MATWIPTCAPNLGGHPSWGCPSCSRATHVAYPWNATLMGLSASSVSLLVSCLNALFTPHTWTLHDLGFPLLITVCCLGPTSRGPVLLFESPMPDITSASLCCWGHIGIFWWSTSDHSSAPWHMPLVRPSLHGPPLLVINDVRGLVGTETEGALPIDCTPTIKSVLG